MLGYLAKDVEAVTGVKRTRLQQWLERGYVMPSIQEAHGHGTRNVYSRNDLYTIALFKKITESGLSRDLASRILSTGVIGPDLDLAGAEKLYFLVLLTDKEEIGARVVPCESDKDDGMLLMYLIRKIKRDEKFKGDDENIFIFNLGSIVRQVDKDIKKSGV